MLNGRDDFIFPLETVAKPLFGLLGTPADRKRLAIHDGGHLPPLNDLIRDVLGWFDQYLGPVTPMNRRRLTGTERTTHIKPKCRVFAWARNPNR
jgi:hypothetical protein